MKKFFLSILLMVCASSLIAQTEAEPWWLDFELTNNKFNYRFYEGIFDFGQLDNAGIRVGVDRYISKSFDAEFGISYGKLIYENLFDANLTDIDLKLVYKLANGHIFKEESKVAPFLFVGYGMNWFNNVKPFFTEFEDGTYSTIPFGGGVEFKVTEGASIVTRASYKKSIQQAPSYMQYSLGVSFSLSRKKDSDSDGIYDKEDACPNTAGPAENQGCPYPDTDKDGVLDKDDPCPQLAGTLNGCPDSDGDGIKDSDDSCPNVAGIARFNGCPDSDNDGIKDGDDRCPNQAGPADNNGCPYPDSDNDGVLDKDDACPNVAGTLNGCPDSDRDGVKDSDDRCPQTAGLAGNGGCPEVKEEVKKVLELAVKSIQFNSGSDVLKTSSYASLDQVVALMKEDTSFKLKLTGYTDNTGNVDSNLDLSKRRANEAMNYLIGKGVSSSRLSSDGFGIANPIADNNTREGRAANRRVELEIVFN